MAAVISGLADQAAGAAVSTALDQDGRIEPSRWTIKINFLGRRMSNSAEPVRMTGQHQPLPQQPTDLDMLLFASP